ncbi:deSI-like protein At4g17486 [Andrographis paniculata]|uniref:deSI-like protein At4g17486 n=1 Tax=Andrographis paniculata TaxID=175694 RepID=UPI0021E7398A|nr:deSI-like protein At4g17486 [Andrographis paniculata]
MLCRKTSVKSRRGSEAAAAVHLNVYDLTSINGYAYWLGLGVYHSGVQVHGVEYAFGAHEFPTTGIFESEPRQCDGFTFRKSILIGWTELTAREVRAVMEELAGQYRGDAYNLITKNCNHFCNDACLRLTGNSIPRWVNRLARIGFFCRCVIPDKFNSTKVRHHKIDAENGCCRAEKNLESRSNRFGIGSSNSSSSSSSSPPNSNSRSRRGGGSLLLDRKALN